MRLFYILFFFMLCLVRQSFSQSEFLTRGQSGYGGGFGLCTSSEGNGLNLYAGYSFRGFVDANLIYSRAKGGSVQGGVISPEITFYPIKQEDAPHAPTIGVSLGYSHYKSITTTKVEEPDSASIIGWHWHENNEEQTINALILGVTVQRITNYWNVFFFQPLLGADLLMKNAGWEFTLRGGVSVGTRVVNGQFLTFMPSIEIKSGLTTFVFNFGTVF